MRASLVTGEIEFSKESGDSSSVHQIIVGAGGRWYRESRRWRASVDLASRVILRLKANKLKVHGSPDVVKAIEAFYENSVCGVAFVDEEPPTNVLPHQRSGARWLAQRRSGLLCDEMGLGKSRAALLGSSLMHRVFVLSPASVCHGWRGEIEAVGKTSQLVTEWQLPETAVNVMSYDGLKDAFTVNAPVCLIADEAHICGGESARTHRFATLAGAVLDAGGWVWGLTATPITNEPRNLWTLLSSLRLERAAFGSWEGFTAAFSGRKVSWGWVFGKPNEKLVGEALRRVSLRRNKDVLTEGLPRKRYETAYTELTEESIREIDDAVFSIGFDLDTLISQIEREDSPELSEWNGLRRAIAVGKAGRTAKLLETIVTPDSPAVVFSASPDACELIGRLAGGRWAVIVGSTPVRARAEIISRFQAGELDGLAVTIRCGGVGLTLTRAHNVIFNDREWSDSANLQAEDRVHRLGQTHDVTVYDVISNHVVDDRLSKVLRRKRKLTLATTTATDAEGITPLDDARKFLQSLGRQV